MRSNGLTAAAYSPVADLNPRVADVLLDELRDMQVAAYSQPIETSSVAGFDRPEFVTEVLVRLYVDAAAVEEVRELLEVRDPLLLQENEDLTWAQIVAGYDAPAATAVAPWPVYEDVDPDAVDEPDDPPGSAYPEFIAFHPHDEDRFIPPLPPPLPRLSTVDAASWLGLIGGPIVLVSAAVFSLSPPPWVTLFAVLGFIGGFVSLVIRMDNGEDRLDDPDHGAQV
jgi:hypothetical protein